MGISGKSFSLSLGQLPRLKDSTELGEGIEFDELLAWGRGIDGGVFEDPGVLVEEEDGVEAGGEGGVDVAFGAVADHPTGVRRELVAGDDLAVGGGVFFLRRFQRRRSGWRGRSGRVCRPVRRGCPWS